ncbi:HlyD family efflux transporter periplasmic adaptor subunit [Aureibaculum sp. A20]|uniref:HlyD family efflux transporter periplasmic adaptor subunit n=1 Tax=Aureibaculum flavum TaxID=2795986 RepID=A0ABS0WLM4_9FLAO|nr:HlyD family efflux transporter periplasmic adaptor subunit [Aureibaculum flavum]MBJ2172866.1 HlyD family efflux transporter periplasmic adaptor subunit [Aureibaculum flavum]
MRKILSIILSVILLGGAILLANYFIKNKNKPKPKFDKIIKTVSIDTVKNGEVPIIISASGNLVAKNKIELYAEVQGVLSTAGKDFKAGTNYQQGQTILRINSDEFYASLQSQKSNLYNLVTSIMPDIRLDFPKEFEKWQSYLQSFDLNKATPKLPEYGSDKEKYFISGRNITTTYYSVKNLEVKLGKYQIRAPYTGILTEALVTPGTLIRSGQKLGEFIDPSIYEMEVNISSEFSNLLKVGNAVSLHDLEKTQSFMGKVIRVNGKIDQTSQTLKAYIEVKDKLLKEGMYLEADLTAKSEHNAYKIDRKLLIDDTSVYVVNDTLLELKKVNPVYFEAESVIIKGLPDNTQLLANPVSGAYNGMPVKINTKKK